jgi:GT2 family glycosyltransferase
MSILGQTMADFELIIADDGSTDETSTILTTIEREDARVRVVRNEINIGTARSMNRLFGLAQGEYLNRHDADDVSLPERFEQQVAFLDANPEIGLVSSQVAVIDGEGRPLELAMYSGRTDDDTLQQQLLSLCPFCQTSVMFRRQLLDRVGTYDVGVEWAEDYDLWLRLAEVTRLARLPQWLCQYRHHAASISHRRSGDQLQHTAEALAKAAARRFGDRAPASLNTRIALFYAWGAEKYCHAGDLEGARRCLISALAFGPDQFALGHVNLPILPMDTRLAFAESVFQAVPHLPNWAQVRARFLASLRMKEVFEAVQQGNAEPIDANLWAALRSDPRWLFNRGVLSITLRSGLRRIGSVGFKSRRRNSRRDLR